MTWEQIREMSKDPLVDIGAHTINHHALSKLTDSAVHKEIEDSHPYLEIGVNGQWVVMDGALVTQKHFRWMLKAINAGSGFRFRMKKEYINGIYQRPNPPKWLNKLLIQEGWMPIMES